MVFIINSPSIISKNSEMYSNLVISQPARCNYNNICMNNINLLSGIDIGIPLNIFSDIYTNLHYGYSITTFNSIIIQFLLGYYTYGKDRYNDALEYENMPYNTKKSTLYKNILENKRLYDITLFMTFLSIIYILFTDIGNNIDNIFFNLPFIPILYLCGEYKSYKIYLREYKALFIGIMWTISSLILPCALYDHNYNILYYPIDYIPCILTLFATSNFADIKDIDEDRENNITTIPVKYGLINSNIISFIALVISSILLIENNNFENRIFINSIVEIQNFVLMGLIYNNTFLL